MNEQKAMKAYKALRDMESAADLKRAGLTLAEYREAQDCLQEYARNNGEDGTATISEAVARWYKKQGFTVTEQGLTASAGIYAEQKENKRMPKFLFKIEETRERTVVIEAEDWEQAYTALSKATDRDDERFDLTRREITDLSILDETEEWTDEDTGEIAVTGFDEYKAESGRLIEITEQNGCEKVQGA